jgi:hypothetical protein
MYLEVLGPGSSCLIMLSVVVSPDCVVVVDFGAGLAVLGVGVDLPDVGVPSLPIPAGNKGLDSIPC